LVDSNEAVLTDHVRFFKVSRGRAEGRCFRTNVDVEKRVKPVSEGEGVTAVNNWNLINQLETGW
jgi:hypothetical protein